MSSQSSGTTDAPAIYRDSVVTNVAVSGCNTACELTGWNIINTNTTDVYLKFSDVASGTTTIGTTAVVKTLLVPASTTIYMEHVSGTAQQYFNISMTCYCVTGFADSNSTAPTTGLYVELFYKRAI